jgi:hypothetical protein
MIEDNTKISKYILIDTLAKPPYAYLGHANLSKFEANTKNRAFKMNRVNKKYILEEDWK